MRDRARRPSAPLVAALLVAALGALLAVGCDSGDVGSKGYADAGGDGGGAVADRGLSFADAGDGGTTLTIAPAQHTLTVVSGQPAPTVQYSAKLNGSSVSAKWSVDRGELGGIDANGLFTASGSAGGVATISAVVGKQRASATLTIKLEMSQNGATQGNGNPGPGGFGGVGGEGLGVAAPQTLLTVLGSTPKADASMKLLYPYDQTVWPLGILAPLIQWNKLPAGAGDGVKITLSGDNFSFSGTFGRPAALAQGAAFVRHPIPQDVWKAATRSAAGGKLTLEIIVASSGVAYGPLKQTWTIASGGLRGTVYYQSYGTALAKNYSGAKGGDGRFGGATLAIRGGSTDPVLVAGKSGGNPECRVCHTVAAGGTRMIVQHGDRYSRSSSYDLTSASYTETPYAASTDGKLGWIGMTTDGKLGLSNGAPLPGGANSGDSALYDMQSGTALAATGLSSFVTRAGFPMFSPSSQLVAFMLYAGPGDAATGAGDGTQLVLMDFDANARAFSNPRLLYKGSATQRPGWPAFWPTNDAVVFQREVPGGTSKEFFATRYGARGELWWVDVGGGKAVPLRRLNGRDPADKLIIPSGANNHNDDATLNYEPTISPIASGGYAWVVFISRRLYGNVATIDPWSSDPREHDLVKNVTTKKLWVAALDLKPKAGADPSHPAFYLPAQELRAGNGRAFWVADPCKADGKPCEGGDECCGGYCTRADPSAPLTCGRVKVGCAKQFDKCAVNADCCDYPKLQCINGRCAKVVIN